MFIATKRKSYVCYYLSQPTLLKKSRETLALLENKGIQPIIELYLQKQYSVNELQSIAKKIGN